MSIVTNYRLLEVIEDLGKPTLTSLGEVINVKRRQMYAIGKSPDADNIFYNGHEFNWKAIERFIINRIDPNSDLNDLESVVAAALKIDAVKKGNKLRKTNNQRVQQIEVDGNLIVTLKHPQYDLLFSDWERVHPSGARIIVFRKDPNVYKIVMQTRSHTLVRSIDDTGEYDSDELKVITNSTLNFRAVSPRNLPKEYDRRKNKSFVLNERELTIKKRNRGK